MEERTKDQLNEMLKDGWAVSGYSVCMAAAGALVHNILLQKEECLQSISIITNGAKELGRSAHTFSPTLIEPIEKKGFFDIFNEEWDKRHKKRNK